MNRRLLLLKYHDAMLEALGPSHWWPGETPFEIALGAILTQNTNWTNVEKALANLRDRDLLDPARLDSLPLERVEELIRPAGFFRIKARRISHFMSFLRQTCDLELERLSSWDPAMLRPRLLQVSGIGPETADSILLYALGFPVFVVDAYTLRILSRHNLVPSNARYQELQAFFMDSLPHDPALFNEFHALIVRTAKTWCRRNHQNCRACPLGPFLDHGNP